MSALLPLFTVIVTHRYYHRVQDALKAAGVIFVEENGEGLGVRLMRGR